MDLFWIKVHKTATCWNWTASKTKEGYGRYNYARGSRAHRAAYEMFYGPIPAGMTVDHLCFNTSCVNPVHLRLLTAEDNSRNRMKVWAEACAHGHPWTPDNIYMSPGGQRDCRACVRQHVKDYRARKAARSA